MGPVHVALARRSLPAANEQPERRIETTNMTTIRRITTVALVGTVAGALAATSIGRPQQGGSTTLPFTFQADTPARADEVNQNFQVLDDRTRSLPGGNLQAETITQREIDDFSLRGPDISASGGDVSIDQTETLRNTAAVPVRTPQPKMHAWAKGISLGSLIAPLSGTTQYSA